MNALRNTLTQDAFWQINKALVSSFGIEGAVILTDLIEKFYYFIDREQTVYRDGKHWFYFTAEDIERTFKIGYKAQRRILTELREKSLIETKVMQVPAKLHIHICERNVMKFLNDCSISILAKLDMAKGENLINPKGNSINNNIPNNNPLPNGKGVDVLFGDNCFTDFINEVNKSLGKKFKETTKVKTSFRARIKAGYTCKDLIKALENAKQDQFHLDNQFNHLTPEFLTRADKLEKYLNYVPKQKDGINTGKGITLTF